MNGQPARPPHQDCACGSHFFTFAAFLFLIFMPLQNALATIPESENEVLQFTTAGHVLGFEQNGVYVAGSDHMMKVAFAGAQGVAPEATNFSVDGKSIPSLQQVTYNDLWPGVDLVYETAAGGIVESTWHIAAGADPQQIRLTYNTPVIIEASGDLKINFETGWMMESKPIAWQKIEGRRVPVQVAFSMINETGYKPTIGFEIGQYDVAHPLLIDPVLGWNTFVGSSDSDWATGIAVDSSGNVYVVGESYAWGTTPVNDHSGGNQKDVFIAMFNTFGVLQWHTFMGNGDWNDESSGIALGDDLGDTIFVVGTSVATWGAPVAPFTGGIFVAELNNSGVLQWNTFMGSSSASNYGYDIAANSSNNAYVTGVSCGTWGSPVNTYTSGANVFDCEAFAAKIDTDGALVWNTFMGSTANDYGKAVALDSSNNIYVTGASRETWGTPVNAHATGWEDAFVAKLQGADGVLAWNTFMGSTNTDQGKAITVDAAGYIYLTGESNDPWGTPVNDHTGNYPNVFAAKLDSSGVLQWHTFMGSNNFNHGEGIAVDCFGTLYITGDSKETWGTPWNAHTGEQEDAFVAKLDTNGTLIWNTFMGAITDLGRAIAIDAGNIYVAGSSDSTWGTPINAHTGSSDALIFKITPDPPEENTSWSVRQITNSSNGGRGPVLSNTHIMWSRWDDTDSNTELYVHDGATVSWLSTTPFNEQNLFASDKYITWNSRRSDNSDDIYLYDGKAVSQVTTTNTYEYGSRVDGESMVWESEVSNVQLYDIATKATLSFGGDDWAPWIFGNWVSFSRRVSGIDSVWYHDIAAGTDHEVGVGVGARINNEYIAYSSRNSSLSIYNIMLYDRATDTKIQLTDGGTTTSIVGLDGSNILWECSSGDSRTLNDFLILHDTSSDTTKVLAGNIGSAEGVSMDGNLIVYAGYDGNDWEIYIYDITSGVTTQLTDNDYSDQAPKIRGERIVWVQEVTEGAEMIMLAYSKAASPWVLFMPTILTATEAGK